MTDVIVERLEKARVIAMVQSDDPGVAVDTGYALIEGGVSVLEVVLRTDRSVACLEAMVKALPEAAIGAGTVLSSDQSEQAVASGAQFLVCPGIDDASVAVARRERVPIYPGVATSTELLHARGLGLRTVKFFPASLIGGPQMIVALSSVFADMRFIPTGGINAGSLSGYLELPSVVACGGTWMTPRAAVRSRNWAEVTDLARNAVSIARRARKGTGVTA